MRTLAKLAEAAPLEAAGVVRQLRVPESDEALVRALRGGKAGAADAFFQRYADQVRRVVTRVMSFDSEIDDIVHDVFLDALRSIDRLKDPDALPMWLTSIALFKARRILRQRKRRSWIRLTAPAELDTVPTGGGSEIAEAMHCTYLVLNELPADERIAFALRFIEGMELVELATACRTSVATIRRRLERSQQRFLRKAQRYPVLSARIAGGRWTP